MRKLLRVAKRFANKIFGTASDSWFWKFRHAFDKNWALRYISEESLSHPHRKLLVDTIVRYSPQSVLEIGCASGPNLVLLSQKLPNAKLEGVDVSAKAIETGGRYLELQKIKNVELQTGNVLKLKNFPDKSFDLVLTDATLIYVDKNRIESVLKELIRIAKKAVILNEWLTNEDTSAYVGHWAHNYQSLIKKLAPKARVKTTKITPEIWPGDWSRWGYVLEVDLKNRLSKNEPT